MTKRYGCRCGPLNDCGEFAGAGWACECDGQGHCTDYGVGGFDGGDLTGDKLQAAFEASTTRFLLDNESVFVEVGLMACAGVQVGDVLVSVYDGQHHWLYEDAADRQAILVWQFTEPELMVSFLRGGVPHKVMMDNSKISLAPKEI